MKSKERMIREAMEQLKNGNVEEVLASLVSQAQAAAPRSTRKDRTFVPDCFDLGQLRKELKSAYGAKSKMRSNKAAAERYNEQIHMIQRRISELYVLADESNDCVRALLDFNEDKTTVLQVLVMEVEKVYYLKVASNFSKAGLKRELAKYDLSTPVSLQQLIYGYLGNEGCDSYERRVKRGDQRVIRLNRLVKLAENGVVAATM